MTNSIWNILAETPWWVYVLFIYLIRLGIKATKPQTVPLKNLLLLPLAFFTLSCLSIYFSLKITALHIALWSLALLVGSFLGFLQGRLLKIKAIKHESQLHFPGSWSLLIMLLIIFASKYYLGHETAIDPAILTQPSSAAAMFALYGLMTGLFFGRVGYAIKCIKVGPYLS